jgi:hypothetical protein
MKPTYEELEAQAAAYRQTLIDIKKLGPYIKVPIDLARPEELTDEALLSAAGQDLLTRLETLEKAFDLMSEFMVDQYQGTAKGWRDYFLKRAGESK